MNRHGHALDIVRPTLAALAFVLVVGLVALHLDSMAGVANWTPKEISASVDVLMSQGNLDSARVVLRSALASDSLNVNFWLQLARVEKKRGRASAHSDALRRVFQLAPRTVEGRLELVPDLIERNKADSALLMAKQAVSLSHSLEPMGWYWLGRAHQHAAQFDSASVAFQRAYALLDRGAF
jgi:cytochrome c-type biogenesis protein CcmH/NrfG